MSKGVTAIRLQGSEGTGLSDEAAFERVRMRRFGRTIGALFAFGSLSAIPGAIRVDANPLIYPMVAGGLLIGLACVFVVPWERYSRRAFYVTGALGIVEPALAVAFGGPELGIYYAFVVVTGAYVYRTRTEIAALLVAVSFAMLLPITYSNQDDVVVSYALFAIPTFAMVAVMVRYLREQLERHDLATRAFAHEALAIADRLRGGNGAADPAPNEAGAGDAPARSRQVA